MKYIRYKSQTYGDIIYLFPECHSHFGFNVMITSVLPGLQLISAGFVDSAMHCHGESTSLKIKSLEEDTSILLLQFKSTERY